MSLQIVANNELRILKNQEAKYIIKIMKIIMGFLILSCIFLNVDITREHDFSKGQFDQSVHIDQKVCPF
jgi:hypothetical protein